MKKTLLLFAVTAALFTSSCYRHVYHTGTGGTATVYNQKQWKFINGLVGESNIRVNSVCPSGNATIIEEQNFVDWVILWFTGGLISPTTVQIKCNMAGASGAVNAGGGTTVQILTPAAAPPARTGYQAAPPASQPPATNNDSL